MYRVADRLKVTPLYEFILPLWMKLELYQWLKRKKTLPTPQLVKHQAIQQTAYKYALNTLVETGTYLGATVQANRKYFSRIYTVELDKTLYKRAKEKFNQNRHVTVLNGDSGKLLPTILTKLSTPSLFWLDAHYSKGITAQGAEDTPVMSEIKTIIKDSLKHAILIDDAVNFNGKNGYPTIETLRGMIAKSKHRYNVSIKNNIIHVLPQ